MKKNEGLKMGGNGLHLDKELTSLRKQGWHVFRSAFNTIWIPKPKNMIDL